MGITHWVQKQMQETRRRRHATRNLSGRARDIVRQYGETHPRVPARIGQVVASGRAPYRTPDEGAVRGRRRSRH